MLKGHMKQNLDEFQNQVVVAEENLLVIAGPGSGKTTTILHKVNYLLEKMDSQDILLISFTNKSVEDIKKKGIKAYINTFHKLAIDILKTYHYEFKICDPNLLDYIIDEYFLTLNNKEKQSICQYLKITKLNLKTLEYQSLKRLIITFINLFKTNNRSLADLKNLVQNYHDKIIIKLILDIFLAYEQEKRSTNTLDFDDLIIKATKLLNNDYQYHHFKAIIVDEFQDTSLIRVELIQAIYKHCQAFVTAVGDDAQSIYHFSGCDLKIFLNFQDYFPNAKIVFLKNTYRNSQELIDISSQFINKNPLQIKKEMQSNISIKKPFRIIYYFNPQKALRRFLNKHLNESADFLILSRNKKDIYTYLSNDMKFDNNYLIYQNKQFLFMTIHSSKGLESKYVLILNVSDSMLGIPNKIENHPILDYVQNPEDNYPYAEERRVFFVGITRCKKITYLLVPWQNPSPFIKEIT